MGQTEGIVIDMAQHQLILHAAAWSDAADTATRALCRPLVASVRDGWGGVHQRAEHLPHGKPGHLFGRNRHCLARVRVASGARLAAPEPEATKAAQLHFVPGT